MTRLKMFGMLTALMALAADQKKVHFEDNDGPDPNPRPLSSERERAYKRSRSIARALAESAPWRLVPVKIGRKQGSAYRKTHRSLSQRRRGINSNAFRSAERKARFSHNGNPSHPSRP